MRGLAWIFAAAILTQVFLAGLALFSDPTHWASHASFASYFSVLPIVMLATAFIAKLPGIIRLHNAILLGIILLMFVSGVFSSELEYLSALHPVIALFLFYRTMTLIKKINLLINDNGRA